MTAAGPSLWPSSAFIRQGWQVQFLEADLKTPLPKVLLGDGLDLDDAG